MVRFLGRASPDDGTLRELPEGIQWRSARRYPAPVVPVLRGGATAVETAHTLPLTAANVLRRVP